MVGPRFIPFHTPPPHAQGKQFRRVQRKARAGIYQARRPPQDSFHLRTARHRGHSVFCVIQGPSRAVLRQDGGRASSIIDCSSPPKVDGVSIPRLIARIPV